MLTTIIWLVLLALSTLLWQLIGLPIILLVFQHSETKPEWWAWGRLAGWLAVGLIIWLISSLGFPLNTTGGFWLVLVILPYVIYGLRSIGALKKVKEFVKNNSREILWQEAIFLIGFLLLSVIRGFHPAVLDLEKFMNAGLMAGYLRSPTLPAIDFWLAGKNINYYSFSHFLESLLLRFWNLPVEVGFNVILGWMMGLILLESFALGQTLLRPFLSNKKSTTLPLLATGLLTALLLVFGGNTHPVWYFITHHGFSGYWYPDVTRLVEHSIHEIPAYSFIVSDLHAHFASLPIVLMTIFGAWHWFQQLANLGRQQFKNLASLKVVLLPSLTLGVLLGALGMSNTWDMLIYGIFLFLLGCLFLGQRIKHWPFVVSSGLIVITTIGVVLAPWYLNFDSIVAGVFWVNEHTPLWQFIALWSGQITVSLLAIWLAWLFIRKHSKVAFAFLFIFALGLAALLFLTLPEVIYFKDIYPTYPRANTMFKFAFQAFVMMTLLSGWLVGFLLSKQELIKKWLKWGMLGLLGVYLALLLAYPFLGYPTYYDRFKDFQGLDGLAWLKTDAFDDYQAIVWLRNNVVGRPVVLEAAGDSYTKYGRVSVFTGLPTVLGWRAHEWLWRGGYEIPRLRTEEVALVYKNPQSYEALAVLNKYQVKYIFIGDQEWKTYQLDLTGLQALGKTVFQQGRTYIIER